MSGGHIATKLHVLSECVNIADAQNVENHPIIVAMKHAASYVVDTDVLNLMQRMDIGASLKALHEAGIARLPNPSMCVEFELLDGTHRFFVLAQEIDDRSFKCNVAYMDKRTLVSVLCNENVYIALDSTGFNVTATDGTTGHSLVFDINDDLTGTIVAASCLACNLGLLMLNTKGIEKRVIECHALNKAREKKNKPSIQTHTIVRIGTVYHSDGTAHKYTPGFGNHKIMHVRSAYTRRQHYGTGNELLKHVFIPQCIVNFVPGEEVPQVKKAIRV